VIETKHEIGKLIFEMDAIKKYLGFLLEPQKNEKKLVTIVNKYIPHTQ